MKRIPSHGLCAISIAMVLVGHLAKSGHGPRIFWTTYAGIGVSIFFVISGYLITTILLKEHRCLLACRIIWLRFQFCARAKSRFRRQGKRKSPYRSRARLLCPQRDRSNASPVKPELGR